MYQQPLPSDPLFTDKRFSLQFSLLSTRNTLLPTSSDPLPHHMISILNRNPHISRHNTGFTGPCHCLRRGFALIDHVMTILEAAAGACTEVGVVEDRGRSIVSESFIERAGMGAVSEVPADRAESNGEDHMGSSGVRCNQTVKGTYER